MTGTNQEDSKDVESSIFLIVDSSHGEVKRVTAPKGVDPRFCSPKGEQLTYTSVFGIVELL